MRICYVAISSTIRYERIRGRKFAMCVCQFRKELHGVRSVAFTEATKQIVITVVVVVIVEIFSSHAK